ncbi:MAG: glycosyltransferase, partial [Hyphomicrobiaceae bacterium]
HGGYRHILYDDRSAAAYLKTNAAPSTLQAFLRTRDRTQRADVFRLARLYAEGGIYIDADDRCRGPLEPLLRPGKTFVAFQEDYGSIANNFLAATPQHPVIKRALACAVEATNRGDLNLLWLSTGTGMLTRAFAQVLAAHKDRLNEFLQTVSIVERHAVRVSLVPQCQASYKRAVRHWQTPPFPSSGSVKGAANAAIKTAISQDITPTTSKAVESTPPIT